MVTKFGMSDRIGPIHLGSSNDEVFIGRDFVQSKNLSEEFAAEIDEEVRGIIDGAYEKCIKLLSENADRLDRVAKVLMEKEKISGEEFEEIYNGDMNSEHIDKTENIEKCKDDNSENTADSVEVSSNSADAETNE